VNNAKGVFRDAPDDPTFGRLRLKAHFPTGQILALVSPSLKVPIHGAHESPTAADNEMLDFTTPAASFFPEGLDPVWTLVCGTTTFEAKNRKCWLCDHIHVH